jgi:hypothetical protein
LHFDVVPDAVGTGVDNRSNFHQQLDVIDVGQKLWVRFRARNQLVEHLSVTVAVRLKPECAEEAGATKPLELFG